MRTLSTARQSIGRSSRPAAWLGTRLAAILVGVVLAAPATAVAGSTVSSMPATGDLAAGAPADVPSIQFEQAREHARDNLHFTPGGLVTVPFRPRSADRNLVDGRLPAPLPAGRASGVAIESSPTGSTWAAAADAATQSVDLELAAPGAADMATMATAGGLHREVLGFLPYWELGTSLNYSTLSTIAYFGVDVDGSGNLIKSGSGWSGWGSSTMTNVINTAHANGTRVALTIESFAWDSGGVASQTALLSSSAARQAAAQQTAAAVRDRGADGVNVDFEPIARGQSANFVLFIQALRAALDALAPGYQVTIDVTGSLGNYDADALVADGAADALVIMGYDFRTGGAGTAGSISPLTSPRVYDLSDAIRNYGAYVPASKLILALPYYGRAWSTTSNAPNGTVQSGASYSSSVAVDYSTAVDLAAQNGRHYDAIEQSAWTYYQVGSGSTLTWRELYYDDAQSLGAKYDMINYWGLRGTGIWALGKEGSHTELAAVITAKFVSDKTAPDAGIVNLPASQSNEGFTVSWTARDDWSGVKSYDVQVSVDGGTFANWLIGATATSATYQAATGHGYAFRVRATDNAGNVGAWDVSSTFVASPGYAVNGFVSVVGGTLNERTSPSTSAAIMATAGAGTVFSIIGGPVSANGYTWYQVSGPVREWNTVTPPFPGLWIAATSSTTTNAAPITPPNSTRVSAAIGGLSFAAQPASSSLAPRTFTPDGDGVADRIVLGWTNYLAFGNERLNVYRADGSLAGTIDLGAQAAGARSYAWDGTLNGSRVPNAQYLIQVQGTNGSASNYEPSPAPFNSSQWSSFGVTVAATATPQAVLNGVTTTSVNLRSGASTSYSSLGTLAGGTSFSVTGTFRTDSSGRTWSPIRLASGKTGWIASWYARFSGSAVAPSAVDLHTSASLGSSVSTVVAKGAAFTVTGSTVDGASRTWFAARLQSGASGWIGSWYPAPASPTPPPAPAPTTGLNGVTSSSVNLRSGPSTGYASLGTVATGTSFSVTAAIRVDSSGRTWAPVRLASGKTGWIASWYARFSGSAATTSSLNVRRSPSTGAAVVAVIPSGTRFTLTGSAADSLLRTWFAMRLPSGASGWLASWYTTP